MRKLRTAEFFRLFLSVLFFPLSLSARSHMDLREETASTLDVLTWPLVLFTLLMGALSAWLLYKKETAEDKFWIQFFGRIFPFGLIIFLISLLVTISSFVFG